MAHWREGSWALVVVLIAYRHGHAAGAAVYPPPLCHAISRGLARQIEYERTGLVGGKQFGRGEIKAMIKKLIAKIQLLSPVNFPSAYSTAPPVNFPSAYSTAPSVRTTVSDKEFDDYFADESGESDNSDVGRTVGPSDGIPSTPHDQARRNARERLNIRYDTIRYDII